ncbi:MAG: recombination mediator RecR [Chlamydiota bacterium]
MAKTSYPKDLAALIAYLKKLPGVGQKTAERFAFQLLDWEQHELKQFADNISYLKERVRTCPSCGCLIDDLNCRFCRNPQRDHATLCILATSRDVYAIEDTGSFSGNYHVLGTLLSPLEGKTPDQLNLPHLKKRIEMLKVKEIILALEPTLEGDATALYLKEQLQTSEITVSRLALGLPIGSSLDFIDEGTLAQALTGRRQL